MPPPLRSRKLQRLICHIVRYHPHRAGGLENPRRVCGLDFPPGMHSNGRGAVLDTFGESLRMALLILEREQYAEVLDEFAM